MTTLSVKRGVHNKKEGEKKKMGCDIHTNIEVKDTVSGEWIIYKKAIFPDVYSFKKEKMTTEVFNWRSYRMFGFLANVRNYSCVPYISEPRGLPTDCSQELREIYDACDYHSASWLTVKELLDFNYEQSFWDRLGLNFRSGAEQAEDEVTEGRHITIKEFLEINFFEDLAILAQIKPENPEDVRIVFWFDN
jgi:hypothetical protein